MLKSPLDRIAEQYFPPVPQPRKQSSPHDSHSLDPPPKEVAAMREATYDQLGGANCPKCGGRMVARNGRQGPYFHCLCYERPRVEQLPPR